MNGADKTRFILLEHRTLSLSPPEKTESTGQCRYLSGNAFGTVTDLPSGAINMWRQLEDQSIGWDSHIRLPGQVAAPAMMAYIALPDDLSAFIEARRTFTRMGL